MWLSYCTFWVGNILVGFGNKSSQASAGIIKRSPVIVVERLERELTRYRKVISLNEHLTSNLHSCCHRRMYQRMTCIDGVVSTVRMHSVLQCDKDGCCGMTMIRDVKA